MSVIKLTLTNLRRKPYQNLAIFVSLFIIYTFISIFSVILIGSNQIIKYFAAQPQITAFIKKSIPETQVNQLIINLQKTGVIRSVHYTSSAEALKIYQKISNNPMLTDVIGKNVLPASLEIFTYNPDQLEVVYKQLETSNIIDDIIYQRNLVHIISKWTKNIRLIGLGLIGLFFLQTLTTIWVVTGFKISGFRESIQIMRLFGASRKYVDSIFILENSIIGSIAGLLSASATILIIKKSESLILGFISPTLKLSHLPYNYFYFGIPFNFLFGGFFGAGLTWLAVRHFIKD